jgi:hypothetical protein
LSPLLPSAGAGDTTGNFHHEKTIPAGIAASCDPLRGRFYFDAKTGGVGLLASTTGYFAFIPPE